jgi:hypothetical protein
MREKTKGRKEVFEYVQYSTHTICTHQVVIHSVCVL